MNLFKALFGNADATPEDEKREADARRFDLMKYDGVKAMKTGRFDYAERCFTEALQLHDDLEARDYLSRVLVQQDKYAEAMEQLDLLIAHQPDNAGLLLQAAHVAYLKEDYALMAQYAQRAADMEGDTAAMAAYLLAKAAIGQNDMVSAIAQLTKSLTLDEGQADARLLRGQTLLKMGDLQGAEADAQWLMQQAPEHEDVLLLAARVAAGKGDKDQALLIYNKVTEVNPFQIDAYKERGQLRYDSGDKTGAQEDLQKVLELNPDEMADVSGDYSAEGIEKKVKQAYSMLNPFGL